MNSLLQTAQRSLWKLSKTLGFMTTALSVALIFSLTMCFISIGSISDKKPQEALNIASNEQLVLSSIRKSVLTIRLAIEMEEWDTIESEYKLLKAAKSEYQSSQELLVKNPMNHHQMHNSDETVQELYSNMQLPMNKFIKSIEEIETLTQSIIRRAPYIDENSIDRFDTEFKSMVFNASTITPIHAVIKNQYQEIIESNRSDSTNGAHLWAKFSGSFFVVLIALGIAPRFAKLANRNSALTAQILAADQAMASRWHFLASMGHAFRTPLTTIMGFASLLSSEEQDKQTRIEYAKTIASAGDGLLEVIEDVLVMSAIQADELRVHTSVITLDELFQDINHLFRTQAEDIGLTFRVVKDDSCPISITSDHRRLIQILTKIIGNAIQYTETGSIDLHVSHEHIDGNSLMSMKIVDTGVGMDQRTISEAFDPFCSLADSTNRLDEGAGLGLTIAQALSKKLGGGITIESAPGAGSYVTVQIDAGECIFNSQELSDDAQAARTENGSLNVNLESLDGCSVLIVEDGLDNQRLLSHHLTKAGCIVQLADDGQVGVDRILESNASGQSFDLVLMDMQMPVLDGYEATSILREDGITIPIIGVTAYARGEDRERCLNAGCSEYLNKPVDRMTLLNLCAQLIEQHASSSEGTQDHESQSKAA